MSNEHSPLKRFNEIKERLLQRKRVAGIYLLEATDLSAIASDGAKRDGFLDFATRLGFYPPDVGDDEWRNGEVFREDARQYITHALQGGAEIGHSRWDMPPADAASFAGEFLNLFGDDGRFYCNAPPAGRAQVLAPYGRPEFRDYIFSGGCVAVDAHLTAVLWVLDND